jgi:helicase
VPKAQFLLLSATVNNANEIGEWMNAKVVISDYRPVKLYEGVCYDSKIIFLEKDGYKLDDNLPVESSIVKNTLKSRKQILFFVGTRKRAVSLAEKLGRIVKPHLTENEKRVLKLLSEDILNVLEVPTKQCKKLAECVKNGVASHHAGYLSKQRLLIEEYFRKGLIKVVVATPTLQLGLNLPAWRVVVRDLKRYYPGYGAIYISVMDYKQFIGRAGRPSYDKFGESIIIARNEDEAQDLIERYILGEPERITSKLAVEPILRVHTLALIASGFCKTEENLMNFFSKTFYAYQFQDIERIKEKVCKIIRELIDWGFVLQKKKKIEATRIGKRVSELYIDPLTANSFTKGLRRKKKPKLFGVLQLISNSVEMKPLPSVRSKEFDELNEVIAEREDCFIQRIPSDWDLEFDDFLRSVKMALIFENWINETTEDDILTKFKMAPGELRSRLEIADWLLYSLHELAILLRCKNILKDLKKLRVRIHYGVKEELLPLVKLKNIGRIRARKLWLNGIRSLRDLRKVPLERLRLMVGPNIAKMIKDQLKGKKVKEKKILTLKDF